MALESILYAVAKTSGEGGHKLSTEGGARECEMSNLNYEGAVFHRSYAKEEAGRLLSQMTKKSTPPAPSPALTAIATPLHARRREELYCGGWIDRRLASKK